MHRQPIGMSAETCMRVSHHIFDQQRAMPQVCIPMGMQAILVKWNSGRSIFAGNIWNV